MLSSEMRAARRNAVPGRCCWRRVVRRCRPWRRPSAGARGDEGKRRQGSQRGVALVGVAVALSLTAVLVSEFSTNTNIDYASAATARDNMQAHFLARSAVNLSELVIRVQGEVIDQYRQYLGDVQLADYTPFFVGAFGGGKDEVQSIAELIGGSAGDSLKGLGLPAGMRFDVDIGTEDDKINMNCALGNPPIPNNLKALLEQNLYYDIYNPIFENADAEGYHRDRNTQVLALIDYVDGDPWRFGESGQREDYGYQTIADPYQEKNNYLDSVGELKLVRGVDDRFWAAFGHLFTVYGGCTVNVSAMQSPSAIASVIALTAKDPNDSVVRDYGKLMALAVRVGQARALGITFKDTAAFAKFVKNPDLGLVPDGTGSARPDNQRGGVNVPVEGVELDPAKLSQIAHAGPRRTYRVEATAFVGADEDRAFKKKITAIWDSSHANQTPRISRSFLKGTWVFWRED